MNTGDVVIDVDAGGGAFTATVGVGDDVTIPDRVYDSQGYTELAVTAGDTVLISDIVRRPDACVTVPSVPRSVTAVRSTTTSAQVSFTPPATNGGSAITSYFAQCTSSDGGTTRTKTGATQPADGHIAVTAGKTYQCRVRATRAIGNGPYSALVPAVT